MQSRVHFRRHLPIPVLEMVHVILFLAPPTTRMDRTMSWNCCHCPVSCEVVTCIGFLNGVGGGVARAGYAVPSLQGDEKLPGILETNQRCCSIDGKLVQDLLLRALASPASGCRNDAQRRRLDAHDERD